MKPLHCPLCNVKITKKTSNGVELINRAVFRQIRVVYDVSADVGAESRKVYHELQGPICVRCLDNVTMGAYEDALKADPTVIEMMKQFPHRELVKISSMQMK